jgi:hypothetical protein
VDAVADAPAAQRFVEIRSYELKPGTGAQFDRLVEGESVPMLRRHGIDVVAFGPSLYDEDAYYLMRSYASREELERSEAGFYGSEEWRLGPREAILACIDRYVSIVVELDGVAIDGLRKTPITRQ